MIIDHPTVFKTIGAFTALFTVSYLGLSYYRKTRPHFYMRVPTNSKEEEELYIAENATMPVSFVHAVGAIGLCSYSLYTNPSAIYLINTPFQNEVMRFSMGYFIYDLVHMFQYQFQWEYFLHHAIALCYWTSMLYLNRGGYLAMVGLLVSEITNPMQVLWSVSRKNKFYHIYDALSPIFTYYYITMRCGVIPILFTYNAYDLLTNKNYDIPFKWKSFWLINLVLFCYGSAVWSRSLYKGYHKWRKKMQEAEQEALTNPPKN